MLTVGMRSSSPAPSPLGNCGLSVSPAATPDSRSRAGKGRSRRRKGGRVAGSLGETVVFLRAVSPGLLSLRRGAVAMSALRSSSATTVSSSLSSLPVGAVGRVRCRFLLPVGTILVPVGTRVRVAELAGNLDRTRLRVVGGTVSASSGSSSVGSSSKLIFTLLRTRERVELSTGRVRSRLRPLNAVPVVSDCCAARPGARPSTPDTEIGSTLGAVTWNCPPRTVSGVREFGNCGSKVSRGGKAALESWPGARLGARPTSSPGRGDGWNLKLSVASLGRNRSKEVTAGTVGTLSVAGLALGEANLPGCCCCCGRGTKENCWSEVTAPCNSRHVTIMMSPSKAV